MASSGSYEQKHGSWLTIKTEWSSTQNQLTNVSTIVCNHYLINTGALSIGGRTSSCTVGGNTKNFDSAGITTTGTHYLGSTTHTIEHDSAGKKTVDFSTTFNIKATLSGVYVASITATSRGIELPTIPRNSTLTYVSGKPNEDYPTILVDDTTTKINVKYKKEVSSYFNVLEIFAQVGTEEKLIKTLKENNGLTEDYVFSFTEDELNEILDFTRNSNLGITSDNLLVNVGFINFKLSTYTDNKMSSLIGSVSAISRPARLTISSSKPSLSATLKDINNKSITLTGDENTLIRYVSTARIIPIYSSNKGALIKSVTINGLKLENYTYLDIVNSSANTYTIVVTDSRSLSTTLVFQSSDINGDNYFNLINYIPLTVRTDSLVRNQPADNKMRLEYSGNYFNGSFSTNVANTLEVSYRYKKTSDTEYSEWINLLPVIENSVYSQVLITNAIFDYETAFDLEIRAIDKIDTRIITNLKLNKGIPIANWDDKKFNINGKLTVNDQDVTSADTLPIGAIVEYDGNTIPDGYEQIKDYSTEEQVVATWINKKPIYRKVFEGNLPTTAGWTGTKFAILPDVDVLVNVSGYFTGSDGRKMTLPYSEGNYEIAVTYKDGGIELHQSTVAFAGRPCYIILEYTKMID